MRTGVARACAGICVLFAAGCVLEEANRAETSFPIAGLYTPGSTLGASDPSDTPQPGAGLGNRCAPLPALDPAAPAPTPGRLRVEYETVSLGGRYAPKNCTAVWIETPDGAYVATIEITAALRRPGLVYFQDRACVEKPGPDVVTSATLPDHEKSHTAVWNGLDLSGEEVADGAYKLFIEVTESDKEPGDFATFDFTKGDMAHAMEAQVAFDGPLARVAIAWEPAAGGNAGAGN
jgi:hypothetical protein